MEFIDLQAQFKRIEPSMRARMDQVLAHGRFIMGPEIKELEERLAALAGAGHCLTCASGTTALDLILMAWDVGPGDAVFTTPLTFIATAESIARTGAVPVFVDIGADFNLDPSHLERAIEAVAKGDASLYPIPAPAREKSLRPRAIVAVDLFGHPADYGRILPLAQKHGLSVLEDAAQSFGGTYKNRPLCGCGCHAAATSFFPAKPLGCYGDGGVVFTDDAELAALVDSLRYHGRISPQDKNNSIRLGVNGRLDTLQAAVVLAKLDVFADEMAARQRIAARYHALCAAIPGVTPPTPPADGLSVWAQYTVLLPEEADRAAVMARMKEAGIPPAVNYPKSLHVQEAFRYLGYAADAFPVVQSVTPRVLSLPMHPYLDEAAQERVASTLDAVLNA
jgi:dTDP-4-amino-4,6-dideoxygalactose transaminase